MTEEPREPYVILLLEDDPRIVARLQGVLEPRGHRLVVAADTDQAERVLHTEPVDVVLADQMLVTVDALAFARRMKTHPETAVVPYVLIGPFESLRSRIQALESGADDFLPQGLTTRALLTRLKSLVRLKRLVGELESTESVIASLAQAVEAKDGYTEAHTERVARYAVLLAATVTASESTRQALKMGGMLHDVGKIGIPEYILNKPGKLTPDEWEIMKQHPVISAKICRPLRRSNELVPMVRHHHERLDGSGYPDGLRGDEIPIGARILAIADFYDACTSDRPYRQAMPSERAVDLLRTLARKGQMDRELVEAFIDILQREAEAGSDTTPQETD